MKVFVWLQTVKLHFKHIFLQELHHQADVCFAEHMLPSCFKTWAELTLQRRFHKQRKHKADVYNQ